MDILVDFDGLKTARVRNIRKVAYFALAMARQGHSVAVRDKAGSVLSRLPDHHPIQSLERVTVASPDVYLCNCHALELIMKCGRLPVSGNCPMVVLGLREYAVGPERRILESADLFAAVKHHAEPGNRMLPLMHTVSEGVAQLLELDGLLDAYLTDDLGAIRKQYPPDGYRIAGFVGLNHYERAARLSLLPAWVDAKLYNGNDRPMGPLEYLRWMAGCQVCVDLPGQHPRTYRFAEAAMLGRPVVCVPEGHQPTIPVCGINAIALRDWDDRQTLDELMARHEEIARCADDSYRRSWSLCAQVRSILDWIHWIKGRHYQTPRNRPVITAGAFAEPVQLPSIHGPGITGREAKGERAESASKREVRLPRFEGAGRAPNPARAESPAEGTPLHRRVLAIYDQENWAYHRRAQALQQWAPPRWTVDAVALPQLDYSALSQYQLIYLLDYAHTDTVAANRLKFAPRVPFVVSFNADPNRRDAWWERVAGQATWVVAVNRDRYKQRRKVRNCCCISNGVSLRQFRYTTPIMDRPDRILWVASAKAGGEKGYQDILQVAKPELEAAGFECDFRVVRKPSDRLDAAGQSAWYNSGSYILCVSESEGTANTITEGAACGCVPVSTRVGNIMEWGEHQRNCVLIDRTVKGLVQGIIDARNRKEQLGPAAREKMQSWDWRFRSQCYFQLFGGLIRDGAKGLQPFFYSELGDIA